MDPLKTGNIISEARKKLNMTQKDLANRLWRVSTTTYSAYLKIFLPFLTLGFSATLYGIATLLDNNKQ